MHLVGFNIEIYQDARQHPLHHFSKQASLSITYQQGRNQHQGLYLQVTAGRWPYEKKTETCRLYDCLTF